jgi:hypothetical protein
LPRVPSDVRLFWCIQNNSKIEKRTKIEFLTSLHIDQSHFL